MTSSFEHSRGEKHQNGSWTEVHARSTCQKGVNSKYLFLRLSSSYNEFKYSLEFERDQKKNAKIVLV